jgi:hypothetical protein
MVSFAPASAQSKPSVPEFTLKYVDNSYDVPPKTTTTTNPYTNETTTTTTPGYHVEYKTVEATINNNIGASYYNFRYKGHYENEWTYFPFDPNRSLPYFLSDSYSVPYQASNSSYTVATLPPIFFQNIPIGGEVDVQVQALFGDFDAEPFGHLHLPQPTYDFYFEGTTSGWSETQTITIGEVQTPTPSAESTLTSDPNFILYIGLTLFIVVVVPFVLLVYSKKRKH